MTVETAIGRIVSAQKTPEAMGRGTEVTVSIRPEVICLNAASSGNLNAFEGMVHDTVYLGEMAQHQVSVAARRAGETVTLKASELHPRIVARDRAERARFWIAPEDVVVLSG
jgi:ABC-type Fe3+/spermidine/putrescine transport system ATPase subunit